MYLKIPNVNKAKAVQNERHVFNKIISKFEMYFLTLNEEVFKMSRGAKQSCLMFHFSVRSLTLLKEHKRVIVSFDPHSHCLDRLSKGIRV